VFGTGPKAQRVVPNKVYQGAAAGCVVVTSDTPPQRTMLGDAALYVVPGDAAALATTLRGLAADPARVDALRHAAYDLADSRFRPEHVIAPLRARLMRGTR
jgi:glycosyltransferase involved in cell wall biosynthesis